MKTQAASIRAVMVRAVILSLAALGVFAGGGAASAQVIVNGAVIPGDNFLVGQRERNLGNSALNGDTEVFIGVPPLGGGNPADRQTTSQFQYNTSTDLTMPANNSVSFTYSPAANQITTTVNGTTFTFPTITGQTLSGQVAAFKAPGFTLDRMNVLQIDVAERQANTVVNLVNIEVTTPTGSFTIPDIIGGVIAPFTTISVTDFYFGGGFTITWILQLAGTFTGGAENNRLEIGAGVILPTEAQVRSFAASAHGGKARLEWTTDFERDNLGFNVYRETRGRMEKVNSQLIAGSALMTARGVALGAGKPYVWWDTPPPGDGPAQYWLEEIDLGGQVTWHGPFPLTRGRPAVEVSPPGPEAAAMLSQIGSNEAGASSPVVAFAAPPRPSPAGATRQAELAARAAVKIGVRQAGWFRVTRDELVAAGLSPDADPRRLQLYVDGRQVPISVVGESDGRLDPTDAVEFYGIGLDTPSTDVRVYWLVAGSVPGRRINRAAAAAGPDAAASFPYTVERKDRGTYFSGLRNGEAENFFGAAVTSAPAPHRLTLKHVDFAAPADAELEVTLQGVSGSAHVVNLELNGEALAPLTFNGQARTTAARRVPHGLLREGENTLTLQAAGGGDDVSLVDRVRLTYYHASRAEDGRLHLRAQGGARVRVGGFARADIRVFDITDPEEAQELDAQVIPQPEGYAVEAAVGGAGERLLLALSGDRVQAAASVRANRPSDWRRLGSPDLMIVGHGSLLGGLAPLAEARRRQGLRVAVIDVEDAYDEFSFGHKSPAAVKEMVAAVSRRWRVKPRFLLLAGDASLDPRNYLGVGDQDLTPTRLLDTTLMETASDDWFADFDEDGVPEMAVGRLPARTAEEAAAMAAKILGYERSTPGGGVTLVADVNDGYDFEGHSGRVRALMPGGVAVESISRGREGDAGARNRLLASLQSGARVVNYVGHGSTTLWRGNLLTAGDAPGLANRERPGLFLTMTCLNGFFQDPAVESLSESLLKAPGGAVAVWSSSGLTNPGGQAEMNLAVMRELFASPSPTIGEAIRRAKAATQDADVRRTWILFGDPSVTLR